MFSPPECLQILVSNLSLLLEKADPDVTREHLVPMMARAFKSKNPEIQVEALNQV